MKIFLFILMSIVFIGVTMGNEDVYVVLKLNNKNIRIGNKLCHINDTIKDIKDINWNTSNDVIQVWDISNRRIRILSATNKATNSTLSIIEKKEMSTRNISSLNELCETIHTVYLFDIYPIYTNFSLNVGTNFLLRYTINGKKVEKPLSINEEGVIVIDRNIYNIDGKNEKPKKLKAELYYFTSSNGEYQLVSGNVNIVPVETIE